MRSQRFCGITLVVSIFVWAVPHSPAQESSSSSAFGQMQAHLKKAADNYKATNFAASAAEIAKANEALQAHAAELAKEFSRMEKARQLLIEQGQKLPELKSLHELFPMPDGGTTSDASPMNEAETENADVVQVSFTQDVAPLLAKHCGSCHIAKTSGQFSAKSYASLIKKGRKGETIVAGHPDQSRVVMLVETRKMPPRSPGIPDEELQILKDWVAQGAQFDGNDEGAVIEFSPAAGQRPGPGVRRSPGTDN